MIEKNDIFYQIVGEFVKASSTTLNYLLEKFVQTNTQIYNLTNKMQEVPYSNILSEGNQLHFIGAVCGRHSDLSGVFSINGQYQGIYIDSYSDIAKAITTLQEAIADFETTSKIAREFDNMSPNNLTIAGSIELQPNEYEFISKSYYTLSNLFDELNKNRAVILATLNNLDRFYKEISSPF